MSERGRDRLTYLLDGRMEEWLMEREHTGGSDMKKAQRHSGDFYCPRCFTLFELINEESLALRHAQGASRREHAR